MAASLLAGTPPLKAGADPVAPPQQNTPFFSGQGLDSYGLSQDGSNAEMQWIKTNTQLHVFGLYIGGNVNADVLHRPGAGGWYRLNDLQSQGWKFAPIWTAYTATNGICSMTTGAASNSGWSEGLAAAERGYQAGLAPEGLIYLDLEPYVGHMADGLNGQCTWAYFYYISAWLQAVATSSYHFAGGLYASPAWINIYRTKANAYGSYVGNAVSIWFARWGTNSQSWNGQIWTGDVSPTNSNYSGDPTVGTGSIPTGVWEYQRARQFKGDTSLWTGSRSRVVDGNCWKGPVYAHWNSFPGFLSPNSYPQHGC